MIINIRVCVYVCVCGFGWVCFCNAPKHESFLFFNSFFVESSIMKKKLFFFPAALALEG